MTDKPEVQKQQEEGHREMEKHVSDTTAAGEAKRKNDEAITNKVNKNTTK